MKQVRLFILPVLLSSIFIEALAQDPPPMPPGDLIAGAVDGGDDQNGAESELTYKSLLNDTKIVSGFIKNNEHKKLRVYLESAYGYSTSETPNKLLEDALRGVDLSSISFASREYETIVAGLVSAKSSSQLGGALSSLFPPAIIVDELGSLAAKRFREELTIAFLEDFCKDLEAVITSENLDQLLPATSETALKLKTEIWKFKSYLNTLHESLEDDIVSLSANAPKFLKGQIRSDWKPEQYLPVLALEMVGSQKPIEVLSDWDKVDLDQKGMEIFAAITRNILDNEGKLTKNQVSDITKAFKDPKFARLFFGLMIQKEVKKTERLTIDSQGILEGLYQRAGMDDLIQKFTGATDIISELQEISKKLKDSELSQKELRELRVGGAIKAAGLITDFLSSEMSDLSIPNLQNIKASLEIISSKLIPHIENKRYGLVIYDLSNLLKNYPNTGKIVAYLDKYGRFIANMSQAKTEDEVEALIKDIVLPVGSYRLKRIQSKTVAFQSYPGIGAGFQRSFEKNNNSIKGGYLSFVTPIGIDYSWKTEKKKTRSIFISVIDIGPIAGWHVGQTEDSSGESETLTYTDDFSWKHVVSPGLYYVFHTTKVLSVGVGGQYSPFAIDITDGNEVLLEDARLWRVGFFVSVDFPLFQIWTKK